MSEFVVYSMSYNDWVDKEYRGKTYALVVSRRSEEAACDLQRPCYESLATSGIAAIFPVNCLDPASRDQQYQLAKAMCKFLNNREKAAQEAMAKVEF